MGVASLKRHRFIARLRSLNPNSTTGIFQDCCYLTFLVSVSSACKVIGYLLAQRRSSFIALCPCRLQLLLTGTCQLPSLPRCQQLTSCRPCTHSPPSCSAWRWNSSSGCMPITHCTVCRYLPRRTTTGTTGLPSARSEGMEAWDGV